ncbi:hypothetical protein ACF0H5_009770 [Mactra antiquata]
MATPLEVPEEQKNMGKLLVFPPPAGVVPIKQALKSPVRTRVSVKAKTVQEEESKTVQVKGDPVTIKTVTLEDESGQGKVTLWRECAAADVRPGDFVPISDVIPNQFNSQTTLSATVKSTVQVRIHCNPLCSMFKNLNQELLSVFLEKAMY